MAHCRSAGIAGTAVAAWTTRGAGDTGATCITLASGATCSPVPSCPATGSAIEDCLTGPTFAAAAYSTGTTVAASAGTS